MPPNAPIDTYVRVETAEAMDIFLRPAGVFARARAYAMDLLFRLLWLWLSSMLVMFMFVGGGTPEWMMGLIFLNLFATMWLYPVLFEVFWHGQTPGKRIFRLQVISDNGAQVGWSASLLRNLLRLADGLPFLYALGMSVMLLHPQGKRIGDVLASTLVVHTDDARVQASWQALQTVPPQAPPARRQELAELLVVAIYGHLPARTDALALALGMARYSVGERSAAEQAR